MTQETRFTRDSTIEESVYHIREMEYAGSEQREEQSIGNDADDQMSCRCWRVGSSNQEESHAQQLQGTSKNRKTHKMPSPKLKIVMDIILSFPLKPMSDPH